IDHRSVVAAARRQKPRGEREALGVMRDHLARALDRLAHEKSRSIRRAVAFAELMTPGTPAPGWVPAPTRYSPGIRGSRLCGRKYALWLRRGAQENAEPRYEFKSSLKCCGP